jgi:cation:H+ antiporter
MFASLPLWLNIPIFSAATVVVWVAGTRMAAYADGIAIRTGFGHAIIGLVLLAGVTSLPEIAVTVTASAGGNAELAVNNLLGSVAMQIAILAAADALIGKDPLTSIIPDAAVLLQIALNVLILALVAAAVLVGDVAVLGIGVWSFLLLGTYLISMWMLANARGEKAWAARGREGRESGAQNQEEGEPPPLSTLLMRGALAGAAILISGFVLSQSGEVIAAQTGLGQSLGGFLLLAIATSLPEVSTVVASVRLGRYVMAVSDIFGTNLLNGGLIFLVDAAFAGGPVLNHVGHFAAFAALLGIVLSGLFLAGLIERRNRTVLRMGYDSLAVLLAYGAGVVVLYRLQ